jgi:hypothetical protein
VLPFMDLKNRISTACGFCMSLFLIVQHSLPYSSEGIKKAYFSFLYFPISSHKCEFHWNTFPLYLIKI